ncbi:hypothetical protein ACFQ9J_13725 [Streptomyces sp. NPDC056529]|uniref:hypothetical protein n=1 Tax=Streptomyces sp. NPDC056529 TaxID=3345855 RepID=UPI0036C12C57
MNQPEHPYARTETDPCPEAGNVLFSDPAPLPASSRPAGLRSPLETLTWQAPPADTDA